MDAKWGKKIKQLEAQAELMRPPEMGVVLVAAKDIPPQVPITHTDLAIKEVPLEYIQPQAAAALDDVIGQISPVPIASGEQILKNKLLPPGKIGKRLAEIIPEGKRGVTVLVDNISSGLSLIRPGDFVDVSALISMPPGAHPTPKESGPRLVPLFQNIEVLAVGSEFTDSTKEQAKTVSASPGTSTVTLALNPQEAALLSFVQENGKIKLNPRAFEDTEKHPLRAITWDDLLNYLSGGRESAQDESRLPTVEIYRGVNKETIPLSEGKR